MVDVPKEVCVTPTTVCSVLLSPLLDVPDGLLVDIPGLEVVDMKNVEIFEVFQNFDVFKVWLSLTEVTIGAVIVEFCGLPNALEDGVTFVLLL